MSMQQQRNFNVKSRISLHYLTDREGIALTSKRTVSYRQRNITLYYLANSYLQITTVVSLPQCLAHGHCYTGSVDIKR